jgi:hypothetical protein
MSGADLLRCIKAVDKRHEAQKDNCGKFTVASIDAPGKSAKKTGRVGGCRPIAHDRQDLDQASLFHYEDHTFNLLEYLRRKDNGK